MDDLLIFLRQLRAGGVHQHAAGAHIAGGIFQNIPLNGRKLGQITGVLYRISGFFRMIPEARTGDVRHYHIRLLQPCGVLLRASASAVRMLVMPRRWAPLSMSFSLWG